MTAIVFDLDGTLIDSVPDIHAIANDVLAAQGAEAISLAEARDFIGNGAAVFVERMRTARGLPQDRQDEMHAVFLERYLTAVTLTELYPGVRAALERLTAGGWRIGLCTNKPVSATRAVLAHLQIETFFETVIGGDSLPVNKPDPAPLHAAFDALGGGTKLYVGDSEVDAQTALAAKVPFALFTEGYRKTPVAALPHQWRFSQFDRLEEIAAAAASDRRIA